jgi:hypothetical protein
MTGGIERYVLLYAMGIETPTDKVIRFVSNSIHSLDPVSAKAD